jgi:hypothetical protein
MWARNLTLTALQVKSIILSTVDVYPQYVGKYVTGGKVNAYKALLATPASQATVFSKTELTVTQ